MTDLRLVQLISDEGGPADDAAISYADMITPEGLEQIAGYADGIGAAIPLLLNAQGRSTGLTETAHEAGLLVHAWTARKENAFLPPSLRSSEDEVAAGMLPALLVMLDVAGVDGVFTDDPAIAAQTWPEDGRENLLRTVTTIEPEE